MHVKLLALVVIVFLSGCASSPYRNYIPDTNQASQANMAWDAIKTLAMLYPPATTQFNIDQPADDVYGKALIEQLRNLGYAVQEFYPDNDEKADTQKQSDSTITIEQLHYVVDQPNPTYTRVNLLIGQQALTRGYRFDGRHYYPAGEWAYKEIVL